ncbi:MAG: YncE family protein [Steroidobacteraceae bacterium]
MLNSFAIPAAALGLIALASSIPAAADAPALYRITQSITLGSPEGWDYLTYDPNSQRVYAAHGSAIDVLDGRSGKLLGRVPVAGANGVVVVPSLGKGYAGSRAAKAVVVFDLNTFKVLKTLAADADTDAVVYDPYAKRVFIMQGDPHSLTVIDTLNDTVVATVALGGQPEFGAVDGAGKLFVNITDKKEIQRVDTASAKVDATWPIGQCEGPHGLSIDPATHRLFASCVNLKLMVVNSTNGDVVSVLPIGNGSDATAFDSVRKRAFSSNREGTLSVIREDGANQFTSLGEVPTQLLARTMALDPVSGRIYLIAADRVEVDPAAADPRKRYSIVPGSVRLLFADPAP